MSLPYTKEIFDPIFGFIKVTQEEVKSIDTLIFQRLHNISQLGMTYMIFPMAKSTRFSHSLGVLAVTQKMLENFKIINQEDTITRKPYENIIEDQKRLVRMSALLHDIGHLPFSHCTENVIEEYLVQRYPKVRDEIKSAKFHEWLSGEIVKKTNIYNPEKGSVQRDREHIRQIIMGNSNYPLFNQLLHSELDADRLDYLLRDAYSTGLSFGLIDLEQILRNLYIFEDSPKMFPASRDVIVYSLKSINAIDNYYNSRMSMYNTVYFHKTKNYFEYLLSKSYEIMINSDKLNEISDVLPKKPDDILRLILENEELDSEQIEQFSKEWNSFDDHYLWNCMRDCWKELEKIPIDVQSSDLRHLHMLLDRLFRRKRSNLIFEKNLLKSILKEKKVLPKRFLRILKIGSTKI